MQTSVVIGSALLAAVLPWSGARPTQDARQQPHRPTQEERQAQMAEQLLGAWQLDRAEVQGSTLPGLDAAGYLLVAKDYLSIELHLAMPTGYAAEGNEPFFQSGIRRWRLDGDFGLQTSALIGCTNLTENERWNFDEPGTRTTLDMVLSGDSLVLEQKGTSKLSFHRLPALPFPGDAVDALERSDRVKRAKRDEGD